MIVLLVTTGLVAGLAAVAWLRRSFVVVSVSGESMMPALSHGDRVLVVRRRARRLRQGDIAVLAPGRPVPGERLELWVVKRVVALPGDPVPRQAMPEPVEATETVVPAGRLVVAGDNAAASADSRQLGYFHTELLLGVVLRKLPAQHAP